MAPAELSHCPGAPRFKPIAFVGRGSMGAVYRVFDEELGCTVALKTLHELSPEQIYRLKTEFRALAGVVHPNLVQLHDLVVNDEVCFFTMEFIDGVDFVEYVRRPGPIPPLTRFLRAAPQLVRGISAVHGAARLHRDVKPSNIRVTPTGHLVLLDFDLATPLVDANASMSVQSAAAGTFAYMAPEQLWSQSVGPAADLYAAGVVFFEALTGRLPFEGAAEHIVLAKSSESAPHVRAFAPSVPEWLDALTASILCCRASDRPAIHAVLARFEDTPTRDHPAVSSAPHAETFCGRERELAALRALGPAEPIGTRIACLHGVSGIGKTQLVRRFLADLEHNARMLVLRGRCHPQESVPYKALDSIVDGISRFLLNVPMTVAREMLPQHAGALTRLFPVLARVPLLADTAQRGEKIGSVENRRRGFAAFRDLVGRMARVRSIVLWIDDLQWGDSDSAALLRELWRPPDAPPLMMLFSYRSEERDRIALLRLLDEGSRDPDGPQRSELEIGPLDGAASHALASQLCPPGLRTDDRVAMLVAQSGGSPFLLAAMAWYLGDHEASAVPDRSRAIDLSTVLHDRVSRLSPDARRIIEVAAVAGGPIDRSVALGAAAQGEAGRPLVARLEGQLFLRTTTVGERPGIEVYHDRIREAVVADLSVPRLSECHRALALALESSGRAEPEVLAIHFHGAGLAGRAADYAVAAADKASDTLAFVRAAELYRQAREWDLRDAAWRRLLLTREGEALANAARFSESAHVFALAAEDAPRHDALDLRRRAAEHLLAAGRIDDGVATLIALLRDLGLTFPRSQGSATRKALWHVARFLLRDIDSPRRPIHADDDELLRIDTCYAAGKGFVDTDPGRGIYFSLEALDRALRAGEPVRLGCALCVVGGSLSVVAGGPIARLGAKMMATAERLATETRSPLLQGTIGVATGQVLMLQGQWREALTRSDEGVAVLTTQTRGAAYECNIGRSMALRAVEELGDIAVLSARARELLQAGIVAGDRFAQMFAASHMGVVQLAIGDPSGARAHARRIDELASTKTFQIQHLYALRLRAHCDLYEGKPEKAYAELQWRWASMRRSNVLRVSLARVDALSLRARLALAILSANGGRFSALRLRCAADMRRLQRERRGDAVVHGLLLHAGLATLRGDVSDAGVALGAAQRAAEEQGMALHAAVAGYRLATLQWHATSDDRREAAAARLHSCGVTSPERTAAVYAPGRWPVAEVEAGAER